MSRTRAYLSVIFPCLPVIPWLNVIVLAASRILLRRHRRTFHLLRQREAHSLEDPSRGYTYTACRPTNFSKPSLEFQFFRVAPGKWGPSFCWFPPLRLSRAVPLRPPAFWGLRFGDTPRSSGDASMDTASPVASRGHSTTLATDSVGARCHWLSEHAAHPSPTHAQSVMHRHSLPLQLPDGTTVVPWATARAARRFLARA